jgi:D-glycerate 3-kinase
MNAASSAPYFFVPFVALCEKILRYPSFPMPNPANPKLVARLLTRIADWRAEHGEHLFTLGLCGAQGSGKSTLVAALAEALSAQGLRVATLSLDDLYLPRAARLKLAREVHPLFATRGAPGTHDVALGLATLDALARGEPARLPRFAKATDEPLPREDWPRAMEQTQVLLFEGWCIGAKPQAEADLAQPVNALEAEADPNAIWRSHANAALAGIYQTLFARIDRQILLAAPNWEVVARWREQQEAELRLAVGEDALGAMPPADVTRFIQHYERLTRWALAEMPERADLVVQLGKGREALD